MSLSSVEAGRDVRQRSRGAATAANLPSLDVKNNPQVQNATLSPPLGQFFINTILNIAGLVAAISFGVFAIISVRLAQQQNAQSIAQNQLSLMGLCVGNSDVCHCVVQGDLIQTAPSPTSQGKAQGTADITHSMLACRNAPIS